MSEVEYFPDPETYVFPEKVILNDGTVLRGKTVGESAVLQSPDDFRIEPNFEISSYNPETLYMEVVRKSDGMTVVMPAMDVMDAIVIYLAENPGATFGDVMAHIIDWKSQEHPELQSDDRKAAGLAILTANLVLMMYEKGLVKITKVDNR